VTVYNVLTKSPRLAQRIAQRFRSVFIKCHYNFSKLLLLLRRKQNTYTIMANLNDSLSAGFDFITAIRFATQYSNYYFIRQAGEKMIEKAHSGTDVAEILAEFPAIFSPDFLRLLLQFKETTLQGMLKYFLQLQELHLAMRKSILLTITPLLISLPGFIIVCILFNQAIFSPLQAGFNHLGMFATSNTQLFINLFSFQRLGVVLIIFAALIALTLLLRFSGKFNFIRNICDRILVGLPLSRQRVYIMTSLSFMSGLKLAQKLKLATPINLTVAACFVQNMLMQKRVTEAIEYLKVYGLDGFEKYLTAFLPAKDAYVLLLGLRLNNLSEVCDRLVHFRSTQLRFIQRLTSQILRYVFIIVIVLLFLWLLVTTLELGTRAINAYQFILKT
jgi:type II secretory pathway component PulF